jgi:acetoin utilization protein AcuB
MKKMPTIKAVMTPFPHFIGIEESIRKAQLMMAEHEIRHLPVVENGKLVSILTEGDLRPVLDGLRSPETADEVPVREVRGQRVCTVDLKRTLDSVLEEMAGSQTDSVLVVKEGRLVGIYTKTDACRSFCDFLRSIYPEGGEGDAA